MKLLLSSALFLIFSYNLKAQTPQSPERLLIEDVTVIPMHINKAFAADCMPAGASLSLARIENFASATLLPLERPKCGQCKSCCGS